VSLTLIERLIGDPRLDAVEADPTDEQAAYPDPRRAKSPTAIAQERDTQLSLPPTFTK
jgi:hypothetical protein